LTSLLMLSLSVSSWSNVCAKMSSPSKTASDAASHVMDGPGHDDSRSPAHSHHNSGNGSRSNHCQHASLCTSSSLAPVVERATADPSHEHPSLQLTQSRPSSQSPDLEPPPPRA